MYVCMCVYMYVCADSCMHACMYVCMDSYMYVYVHVCMYVCIYACMYACMHVCMYVCMYVDGFMYRPSVMCGVCCGEGNEVSDCVPCARRPKLCPPCSCALRIMTTVSFRFTLSRPWPRYRCVCVSACANGASRVLARRDCNVSSLVLS